MHQLVNKRLCIVSRCTVQLWKWKSLLRVSAVDCHLQGVPPKTFIKLTYVLPSATINCNSLFKTFYIFLLYRPASVISMHNFKTKQNVYISKFSSPYILAVSNFSLFQLNAHVILNTYIYHKLPLHISVFVTPSSGRPLRHFWARNALKFV